MSLITLDSGELYNTTTDRIVRPIYKRHYTRITNRQELRATIRAGAWAWPGSYPVYLFFGDGEACCFKCARKEYKRIAHDMKEGYDASFQIVGADIDYEDIRLYCGICNTQIPSSVGDD